MRKIIDKIPLIFCCCMLLNIKENNAVYIAAFLSAAAVSSLSQAMGRGSISFIIEVLYIITCFVFPEFILFLPLITYDIFDHRHYLLCAVGAAALVNAFYSFTMGYFLIIGLIILAAVLQWRTSVLEKMERELISTRDTSTEMNNLLTEKNRHLRENQDYEIHLATLKERNRIAREIHDNVGHLLSRSILQTGALQYINDDKMRNEALEGLSETLGNAMTSIRRSVHDLHDDSIDLRQAVSNAVKPLAERGLIVDTELDFSDNIPNNVKFCFISIVKEGVANIIKHSNCDKVGIVLREHPALYQLMIEDNGKNSGKINKSGIGLSNMRDRINELNGVIQIDSGENGFRIFISVRKEQK
ncbi:MAG: sensor histidine kinase [Ruminococcus sp.]|nr:sensor histidine kinase [Ruminococcus sp.]